MPLAKCTLTIQETLNWIAGFISQRVTVGIGAFVDPISALDPGLTSANYIMSIIMGAPFCWEWNRVYASASLTLIQNTTDYTISLPTFGFLEKAILVNSAPATDEPPNFELEIYGALGKEGLPARPEKITVLLDDDNDNLTFRVFPAPDSGNYTVDLQYQKAPILATALGATTWAPIPDKLAYLYEGGLRAQMYAIYNTPLYFQAMELFLRQLVAASTGLTEMQKAIFLEDSLRIARTRVDSITGAQQGKAVRV